MGKNLEIELEEVPEKNEILELVKEVDIKDQNTQIAAMPLKLVCPDCKRRFNKQRPGQTFCTRCEGDENEING